MHVFSLNKQACSFTLRFQIRRKRVCTRYSTEIRMAYNLTFCRERAQFLLNPSKHYSSMIVDLTEEIGKRSPLNWNPRLPILMHLKILRASRSKKLNSLKTKKKKKTKKRQSHKSSVCPLAPNAVI